MATEKKPKKKFVGLAAKAKRRKQVSESRLAQRTGMSQEKRDLLKAEEELFKSVKVPEVMFLKRLKKIWKKYRANEITKAKKHQILKPNPYDLPKRGEKYGGKLKHGGKAKKMKAYSKGGKAK